MFIAALFIIARTPKGENSFCNPRVCHQIGQVALKGPSQTTVTQKEGKKSIEYPLPTSLGPGIEPRIPTPTPPPHYPTGLQPSAADPEYSAQIAKGQREPWGTD